MGCLGLPIYRFHPRDKRLRKFMVPLILAMVPREHADHDAIAFQWTKDLLRAALLEKGATVPNPIIAIALLDTVVATRLPPSLQRGRLLFGACQSELATEEGQLRMDGCRDEVHSLCSILPTGPLFLQF
jgi:hypothetical protein